MNLWNNLRIRSKLLISFGLILFLLFIVGLISNLGIFRIVDNANEMIAGNRLRAELESRYTQHLLWAKQVSEFLTNSEDSDLNVQTDYRLCDFGKWYYGEGRQQAEALVPELKQILASFEDPHKELHNSAIAIKELRQAIDIELLIALNKAKADHLQWMLSVEEAILLRKNKLSVQMDHTQCGMGKWLTMNQTQEILSKDNDLKLAFDDIDEPHKKLHDSSRTLQNMLAQGNYDGAQNYYKVHTQNAADKVLNKLNTLIAQSNEKMKKTKEANAIFNSNTLVQLDSIGKLFNTSINISKERILSEDKLVSSAKTSGFLSLVILLASLGLGIFLAFFISSSMVKGIRNGALFAQSIAQGDLSTKMDLNQKDEVGDLVTALNEMVDGISNLIKQIKTSSDALSSASSQMNTTSQDISSGASEQASSTEEVSSSMEEMGAIINQNKEFSFQAEQIALLMANSIKKGSMASDNCEKIMNEVADKVTTIKEIAQQTNILALNAAVEASRAGDEGKGFAVVAAEVRKLAERSKEATDIITRLVTEGVQEASTAGNILRSSLEDVNKTTTMVQEISEASKEQAIGTQEINNAISELNNITQSNAAASEELASSSTELNNQVNELTNMISRFRLQ